MKCKQDVRGLALGNVMVTLARLFFSFTSLLTTSYNESAVNAHVWPSLFACFFFSATKDFQPWGLEPEFLQIMRCVSTFHFTNNAILTVWACTFIEIYSVRGVHVLSLDYIYLSPFRRSSFESINPKRPCSINMDAVVPVLQEFTSWKLDQKSSLILNKALRGMSASIHA